VPGQGGLKKEKGFFGSSLDSGRADNTAAKWSRDFITQSVAMLIAMDALHDPAYLAAAFKYNGSAQTSASGAEKNVNLTASGAVCKTLGSDIRIPMR